MLGLTMGKFMPFHNGHIQMIEYALQTVDKLIILVVTKDQELIDGETRMGWLNTYYAEEPRVEIRRFHHQLPHDGVFTKARMDQWCEAVKACIPPIDRIISSESYGAYLADYLGANHQLYDRERVNIPISGTLIRSDPNAYLEYLPDCVKAYYARIRDQQ